MDKQLKRAKIQQVLQNARRVRVDDLRARYAPPEEDETPAHEAAEVDERPEPVGEHEELTEEELRELLSRTGE